MFLTVYIKGIKIYIWRVGPLWAGDGGDRGLEGEDGLDFSGLTGKKPWGR